MIAKEIEYVDFNGQERKEKFYFHLSKPEVIRMEAKAGDTIKNHINNLVTDGKIEELLNFFEELILTSYGEKSSDGRTFKKNEQIRSEFEYSPAYAELFEMLITEEDFAQKFGEGIADDGEGRKNTITPTVVE